jgi:hypothetical protein
LERDVQVVQVLSNHFLRDWLNSWVLPHFNVNINNFYQRIEKLGVKISDLTHFDRCFSALMENYSSMQKTLVKLAVKSRENAILSFWSALFFLGVSIQ